MKMQLAIVSLLSLMTASLDIVVAASPDSSLLAKRFEVSVETLSNRKDGTTLSCGVRQDDSAHSSLSFAFWGALADTGQKADPLAARCGAGAYPDSSSALSATVPPPLLIHEVSAVPGWNSAAMDPGPVGAVRIILTVTSRQRTGYSDDGSPRYGAAATDHRSIRLEPGEEFLVPVPVAEGDRDILGVHEVMLRVRAGWVGREGAVEYGALAVVNAAPGGKIVLDGGDAGRTDADGRILLPHVPVGQREVRMPDMTGSLVTRVVSVVKGRTVMVAPGEREGISAPEPTLLLTGKNKEGFQEYRRVRDEAIMVQIPQGEFLMGNLLTEGAPLPHTVYVSSFLMDKLPVTVGRFESFAAATGRPLPPDPYWGSHDNFPVAFVRWDEARAYCEWTGGRLPTEAEREKAARGTDGRMYPWGSEPPKPERAVFRRSWGQEGNVAAGTRPDGASPYGLLDTGGNMWEFCEDWYDPDYFKSSPGEDPTGPRSGQARVVKGGSWDSRPTVLSASSRNFAYIGYREGDFGFRCVAEPPP